jgi:hypothetical protein
MMDVSNIGRAPSGNPSEACELTGGSHADVYHLEFSLKHTDERYRLESDQYPCHGIVTEYFKNITVGYEMKWFQYGGTTEPNFRFLSPILGLVSLHEILRRDILQKPFYDV